MPKNKFECMVNGGRGWTGPYQPLLVLFKLAPHGEYGHEEFDGPVKQWLDTSPGAFMLSAV
jgi:hypothetical protein